MTQTTEMLKDKTATLYTDLDLLSQTIDALYECANMCNACADACLAEENVADMRKCIRTDLDCADICLATARMLSRQTAPDGHIARTMLQACLAACKKCGDECSAHAQMMDHCRVCAEACRKCDDLCNRLLDSLPV
jgi:hypothetical protein